MFCGKKEGKQDRLADYDGVGVHDCWGSYFTSATPRHAVCNVPILRELFFKKFGVAFGRAN
jgi:hypothetical protein